MSWATLGSLALPFTLQRSGVQARTDLARNSHELTTGRVESVGRHLRGDLAALHAIENRLTRIDSFEAALKQTVTMFDSAQSALDKVARAGQGLAESLVLTAQSGAGPSASKVAAQVARGVLEETVSAMSLTVAGRAVFGGVQADRAPLAPPEALIDALRPAVAGVTSAADLADTLEAWFIDPGTQFETEIYRGGAATRGGKVDDGETAPALPTADDPAIRRQLMAAAMVVLVGEGATAMSPAEDRAALQAAMTGLLVNAAEVAATQARIGTAQEMLDQRLLRFSLERDRLEQARSDKIGVDPYKAAMAVEQARVQLESIYTVTARVARLSLTEFLR